MLIGMRFRVLTYNIHKAIGVDGRFDPPRVAEVIAHHDPDVVLLQEVDRGAPRSNHLDLASHLSNTLSYQYRAASMNVFMKRGKYGNATFSRFPIGRQHNIDLTVSWRKRRGAQHTRIMVGENGRPLSIDVFNVHLGLSATERRRQVRQLLGTPDVERLDDSHACIIGGDMNDWRGLLRGQFAPAGFQCATNRLPGSRRSIKTYPSYAPTGGLDKVFYRGGLKLLHAHRSRLGLAKFASDHLPVIVDFEIDPAGEPSNGESEL
jgi:endonuclease/exonuclease/phosphatase family metal-dependent hydrolase